MIKKDFDGEYKTSKIKYYIDLSMNGKLLVKETMLYHNLT